MSHASRLTVRAASLTGMTALCRSYGVDAGVILRQAGLPSSIESQPDRRVAVTSVNLALELAALTCGCPDFGLRLSELRGFSNLGPISLLARDEPTVGDAIRAIAKYLPLHNDALVVTQEIYDDIAVLRCDIVVAGTKTQANDIAVAMQYRILVNFAGPLCRAEQICLSRPQPADISKYREVFGQSLTFDAEFDGIVVKTSVLDQPNPIAEAGLRPYASQFLRMSDPGHGAPAAERVRRLLETLLSNRRKARPSSPSSTRPGRRSPAGIWREEIAPYRKSPTCLAFHRRAPSAPGSCASSICRRVNGGGNMGCGLRRRRAQAWSRVRPAARGERLPYCPAEAARCAGDDANATFHAPHAYSRTDTPRCPTSRLGGRPSLRSVSSVLWYQSPI